MLPPVVVVLLLLWLPLLQLALLRRKRRSPKKRAMMTWVSAYLISGLGPNHQVILDCYTGEGSQLSGSLYWLRLFAKLGEKRNMDDLFMNADSGCGAVPAAFRS